MAVTVHPDKHVAFAKIAKKKTKKKRKRAPKKKRGRSKALRDYAYRLGSENLRAAAS